MNTKMPPAPIDIICAFPDLNQEICEMHEQFSNIEAQVADHDERISNLEKGGVIAEWPPLYDRSYDVRSSGVKTFRNNKKIFEEMPPYHEEIKGWLFTFFGLNKKGKKENEDV